MGKQLTDNDISTLQSFVDSGDRAGYYSQLSNWGYTYPSLAGGVVSHTPTSGTTANIHLAESAFEQGMTITPSMSVQISEDLMRADFAARSGAGSSARDGQPLHVEVIEGYHHQVFADYGLNQYTWTASAPLEVYANNYQQLGFDSPSAAKEAAWDLMMNGGLQGQMAIYSDMQKIAFPAQYVLGGVVPLPGGDPTAQEWVQDIRKYFFDEGLYMFTGYGSPYPPDGSCFGPEASISMWPLDPEFAPDPNNPFRQYDQDAVQAKIWKKPIELIRVGDYVVSYDKNGNMVPGYVPRTMSNQAKVLLNFHGTPVTPGHVYYRPDSKNSYKYETLIDVLRDDGMIEHSDRVKLRAATNVPVGTPRDGFVQAVTGTLRADGGIDVKERGRIRLGTRFLVGEGKERKSWAVADLIEHGGGIVGEDELIRVGDGPGMPFHWDFSDTLPKPEDFVLACSSTTLEEMVYGDNAGQGVN